MSSPPSSFTSPSTPAATTLDVEPARGTPGGRVARLVAGRHGTFCRRVVALSPRVPIEARAPGWRHVRGHPVGGQAPFAARARLRLSKFVPVRPVV